MLGVDKIREINRHVYNNTFLTVSFILIVVHYLEISSCSFVKQDYFFIDCSFVIGGGLSSRLCQ